MIDLYLIDVTILKIINLSVHTPLLNNIAENITYLGVTTVYLILIILLYLFGKEKGKKVALGMLLVLTVTFIITQLLKELIARPRPYTMVSSLIVVTTGVDPSFPSGHTSVASSMAYVLGKEYGHMLLFMIIPIIVGLTRIYLGVHYPSDVLGGFILGIVIAYLCEYLIKNYKGKLITKKV
jgi:undecaprenyl-diphosphatase